VSASRHICCREDYRADVRRLIAVSLARTDHGLIDPRQQKESTPVLYHPTTAAMLAQASQVEMLRQARQVQLGRLATRRTGSDEQIVRRRQLRALATSLLTALGLLLA
jgi:hypothetical protein